MGVDCEVFCRSESGSAAGVPQEVDLPEGYILFVGRLVEKKGIIYLIRALHEIRDATQTGLVITGFGPEEAALREEVRRLQLDRRVHFTGRQSHEQIVQLLHGCRVAAVPSIIDRHGETEGMPTVVVEAFAAGVPVVGSNVDGIPDVIRHTENGWLCREKDPRDLAAKLMTAIHCDRQAVRSAATATANEYDWRRVAANYLAAIHEVVDGAPPAPSYCSATP